MGILSWNCQGLGSKRTINYLREIWFKHKPAFLFLSETKQGTSFVQKFQSHFGYSNLYTVEPRGTSGGLALFYDDSYNVNIVYSSNRIIDIKAECQGKKIYMSFVYGNPVQKLRERV